MMKEYAVAIYRLQEAAYILTGSGFFLTPTLFATADHVIRDGGTHLLLAGEFVAFHLLFRHYHPQEDADSDDLAIGQLPAGFTSPTVVTLATTHPAVGAACTVAGYKPNFFASTEPYLLPLQCEFNYAHAMRSPNRLALHGSRRQLNDGDLRCLSGGPITNEAGEVIGLLTSGGYRMQPYDDSAPRLPEIQLWAVSALHLIEVLATIPQ